MSHCKQSSHRTRIVCVCVCVCERERERGGGEEGIKAIVEEMVNM